jgi:transposase-like protein
MLIVETIGRIRREHFVQGKTIREIARDLKLSRNTVRKVLRSAETAFSYGREVQPRPKLGRWTEDLDRLLRSVARARRRQSMITRPGIRSSKATTGRRGGAGAMLSAPRRARTVRPRRGVFAAGGESS